jgi:hypothetical protein
MKLDNHRLLVPLVAAVLLLLALPRASAGVVTYIDLLDTTQLIATNNASVTNTVAAPNALGGFRTMSLTTSGGNPFFGPAIFGVDGTAQEVLLSTPASATSFYEIRWGGAGGTAGIGGVDLTGGATNFTLNNSVLNFTLGYTDQPNNFTWTFTDTSTNAASYTGSFPQLIPPNPAINYAISLASFSGAGSVDWTSINFISLSGGGPISLDLTLNTPVSLAAGIPEPGTWAAAGLLLLTAIYVRWRRSRSTVTEEAPAAA